MVAVILQLRFPVVPDQCQGRGTVVNGAFFPVTCHAGSPGCPPTMEPAMAWPHVTCWCQGTESGDLFRNG